MSFPSRIVRMKVLLQRLGVGRATVYRWLSQDTTFPKPVPIGPNTIGWVESELDAWLQNRIRASRPEVA